jgi:phosphoadenosine phosphosulfate reductase
MAALDQRYGLKLKIYFPAATTIENYVRQHGINAFYDSVELRKTCCHLRKVEPLQRALSGQRAWITGMRAEQAATRGQLAVQAYDEGNGLEKFSPLADWSEKEVWTYLKTHAVPYNVLHDQFYPSIGCAPCSRAISPGEDIRAGRWWWENPESKECGLHVKN